jgi:hypothetical protein
LAHTYVKSCSNKGAPGADGQDFADIEAHGVERWLAELALALRAKMYRRSRSDESIYQSQRQTRAADARTPLNTAHGP